MRHRYITKQILLLRKPALRIVKKDIYSQLAETIKERSSILAEWERVFLRNYQTIETGRPAATKDVHAQLAETIAAFKKARRQYDTLFMAISNGSFLNDDKKAA